GLFAATVASFNIDFYKTLQPNTGDTTVALLLLLTQQVTAFSNNSTQPVSTPEPEILHHLVTFKPSSSSILINALWFLSLFLSLLCALFATLFRQWARRYAHSTQRRGPPHIRGRLQVYLSKGMQDFRVERVVEWMVTLLHLAVLFFLTGLVIFLFETNLIVAYTVLFLAVLALIAYITLSILPIFYNDCPYRTPFTPIF
ncbi:hypothetical protein K488DRAFT_33351, partial [Vararia minispora EC-137]